MKTKRGFLRRIIMKLRGIVWQSKTRHGTKVTLYRSGWVEYSDGASKDFVPIYLCSQELIDQIERDIATL